MLIDISNSLCKACFLPDHNLANFAKPANIICIRKIKTNEGAFWSNQRQKLISPFYIVSVGVLTYHAIVFYHYWAQLLVLVFSASAHVAPRLFMVPGPCRGATSFQSETQLLHWHSCSFLYQHEYCYAMK